ncbi:MAG: ECF transporter S component [Olsenella sp.]
MAQNSSFASGDRHSTTTSENGWSTRRIAMTALLCAVAAICTLFVEVPIVPGVAWLKYDPSGIVALVAGLVFGPATGAVVSIVSYLPHIATASGFWGMLMAVAATFSLVMPAALVYRRDHSRKGLVIGLAIGAVVSVAVCIVMNLVVTPIYARMSVSDVAALIVPALLPFNVAKVAINCVVTALILEPVSKALGK